MLPKGVILAQFKKMLDCYEDDGMLSTEWDPRKMQDSGIFKIVISGVPKDNADEIWNKE